MLPRRGILRTAPIACVHPFVCNGVLAVTSARINPLTRSGSNDQPSACTLAESLASEVAGGRSACERQYARHANSDPSPNPSHAQQAGVLRGSQSWLQEPAAKASRVLNYALILVILPCLSSWIETSARSTPPTGQRSGLHRLDSVADSALTLDDARSISRNKYALMAAPKRRNLNSGKMLGQGD